MSEAEPASTPSSREPRFLSFAILFAGVAAVSTGAILVKLCQLSPLAVGAYRMTLGLPFFWLWANRAKPGWYRELKPEQTRYLWLSGILLGLHFATWIASLSYTSVTSSVVLVTTNPIFVGLGSVLFLKEKVTKRLWLGTIVAFLGTVLVAYGSPAEATSAPQPWLGNALALAGAVCMSGYLLLGRRMSQDMPTVCYVAAVYSGAAITLWMGVLLSGSPALGFTPKQWLLLVLLALIPQGVGHTLLNRSLKVMSTSVVAVCILAEPLFATLLAIPVLAEFPSLLQGLGGVFVVLGVVLATAPRSS